MSEAGRRVYGRAAAKGNGLETSHPGVFAAGDVRPGSIKRVASAVGEGAAVAQTIPEFLSRRWLPTDGE